MMMVVGNLNNVGAGVAFFIPALLQDSSSSSCSAKRVNEPDEGHYKKAEAPALPRGTPRTKRRNYTYQVLKHTLLRSALVFFSTHHRHYDYYRYYEHDIMQR